MFIIGNVSCCFKKVDLFYVEVDNRMGGSKMLCENINDLIGNTPLIRLNSVERYFNLRAKIYGKLEGFNLTGSIKDRVAYSMIVNAIDSARISSGGTIIEPTSGNTGIALAALAPFFGLNSIIVMPESMSLERRKIIQVYGAKLILTPASEGMLGALKEAKKLEKTIENSVVLEQFSNESNWKTHYYSTGPEIYRDLKGKLDAVVAGIGTGGTVTGIGKYCKAISPDIKIIAIEPEKSPLISQGIAGVHGLQGIGANFLPKILDLDVIDKVYTANENESFALIRHLAKTEGLFLGISSGAVLSVLNKIESAYKENQHIVVILPDFGNKYLSSENLIKIN